MISSDEMVVLFDTVAESQRAEKALEAAGFPDPEVNTLDRNAISALAGKGDFGPAFWRTLFGHEVTLYEGAAFKKALTSGGAILTVRTHNNEEAKRAEKVLANHNPVDIEARGAGLIAEHRALGDVKDEVLKLAEEQLDVGKRRVETGKTRIRRYVVERPVEAKVTLKEEHAEVIRKALENPTLVADAEWDWGDSTIEFIESREEPVVTKKARIAEEVRLHKGETQRVETIKDTVRKQEVKVERVDDKGRSVHP